MILEIFSNHAQTSVARLQVEMARWQYLMPRLVGAWTHFSRQTGGVRSKGMGEKQIEIDRRIGRARIAKLRKKLAHIEVEAAEQRKLRKDQMKVALVGYTNSGKTTLMHGLTPSKVTGEDQLFATLSAKVKASTPLRQPHILFTDTVGFIGRLPHSLVASFRSTLAETIDADLLVHVIDVSHQRYQWQLETSEQVLTEIGANTKLMIHVFNKIDQLEDSRVLRRSLKKKYPDSYWISAHNQEDVARLAAGIRQHFFARLCSAELQVPASHAELVSQIFEHCIVMRSCYETPGIVEFKVKAMSQALKKLEPIIIHAGGAVELQLSPASSLVQTQNFDGGGEQHEWVPQNAIVL